MLASKFRPTLTVRENLFPQMENYWVMDSNELNIPGSNRILFDAEMSDQP